MMKNNTTQSHSLYEQALRDKAMMPVIGYGTAGTGKTYGACGAAVEWLAQDKRKRFLGVRPNVSFAEKSGFLPGTEREKMEPWIRPIMQNLAANGLSYNQQECMEKNHQIQYMPLEHIQGMTFDDTFIIVDEVQNMTFEHIKGLMTRIGKWSKVVLCGDVNQVSPMFKNSGLAEYLDMIEYYDMDVHTIQFGRDDVLRSGICKKQIICFEDGEVEKHKA